MKHKVRLRFPDHTVILRRQGEEEEDEEDDDEMEDDEGEKEQHHLFVYHSLHNTRDEHMMSSDPKDVRALTLYYYFNQCWTVPLGDAVGNFFFFFWGVRSLSRTF